MGEISFYSTYSVNRNLFARSENGSQGGLQRRGCHRFGFNGKEKVDELYESSGSAYDFGARLYDSRLGRWMACDPLAILYPSWSSYNAFENSPLFFSDPTGKGAKVTIIEKDENTGEPTIKVSCTIYIYSDVEAINGELTNYATAIDKEIESEWNGADGTNYCDEAYKDYKVVFDVTVIPVTSMEELATLQETQGSDPSVNFVHLNNATDPDNRAYSFFQGNSGSWSILPSRRRYSFAHEFGHLLGWRIYDQENKGWDTHHTSNTAITIMNGNAARRVTRADVAKINGGNGVYKDNPNAGTISITNSEGKQNWSYENQPLPKKGEGTIRRQFRYIGEQNNNKVYKNSEAIEEFRKTGEDNNHGDFTSGAGLL